MAYQVGGTPTRKQSFQRLQYLIRIARITLFYRMKLKKRASKKRKKRVTVCEI